jgi:hypothetical protein
MDLSEQELVNCVANPQKCGGTGGCEGATAELGFEYIAANGSLVFTFYVYFFLDVSSLGTLRLFQACDGVDVPVCIAWRR